jgi:hypothetical protein
VFEARHTFELEVLDGGRTRVRNRQLLSGVLALFVVDENTVRANEAMDRALAERAELTERNDREGSGRERLGTGVDGTTGADATAGSAALVAGLRTDRPARHPHLHAGYRTSSTPGTSRSDPTTASSDPSGGGPDPHPSAPQCRRPATLARLPGGCRASQVAGDERVVVGRQALLGDAVDACLGLPNADLAGEVEVADGHGATERAAARKRFRRLISSSG